MNELPTIVKSIVADNTYMVLATCSATEPWAAPLFFAADRRFNFYFVSGLETRHARHIAANPKVSIALFNSTATPEDADGVYVEGTARVLTARDELQDAIDLVYAKRFPDTAELDLHPHRASDFLEPNPRRFYCVQPLRVFKLDRLNENEVDRRVEVSIDELIQR